MSSGLVGLERRRLGPAYVLWCLLDTGGIRWRRRWGFFGPDLATWTIHGSVGPVVLAVPWRLIDGFRVREWGNEAVISQRYPS